MLLGPLDLAGRSVLKLLKVGRRQPRNLGTKRVSALTAYRQARWVCKHFRCTQASLVKFAKLLGPKSLDGVEGVSMSERRLVGKAQYGVHNNIIASLRSWCQSNAI